jgi:hypothetical protein
VSYVRDEMEPTLGQRLLLGSVAVVAAVLLPGHAERLIDTPLTWANLVRALQRQRPGRTLGSYALVGEPRGAPSVRSALKARSRIA